jgi:hypothetical protein
MNSPAYALFEQAMRERKQIVCRYQGLPREICPIILGWAADGTERCLAYQFGGESKRPATGLAGGRGRWPATGQGGNIARR